MLEMPKDSVNQEHLSNPQVGDYWHEMFMPVLCVVRVKSDYVTCLTKQKPAGKDRWTWDDDFIESFTLNDFSKKLKYATIDKCWCDVSPRGHKDVADAFAKSFIATEEDNCADDNN